MEESQESRRVWTPLRIIRWAVPYLTQKGIPNPRFDVELLIAHALKIDRLKVYLQFDRPLDIQELRIIRELLKRRSQHEPLNYITGQREFFGLNFKVGPGVLIPRPETEQLVEHAISWLWELPEEKRLVLDLGTGSGCIAIAIAKNVPCQIWAVDISQKALEIATFNGRNLDTQSIQWRQGHWFTALNRSDPDQFAVITSNPPYISYNEKEELVSEIKDYEPSEALFAENNGYKAYEEILMDLKYKLLFGGKAFFEIHAHGYDKVSQLFQSYQQNIYRDLQGMPRVLKVESIDK